MTKIAIITAMDCEFEAIKSLYEFKQKEGIASADVYDKTVLLIKHPSVLHHYFNILLTFFHIDFSPHLPCANYLEDGIMMRKNILKE